MPTEPLLWPLRPVQHVPLPKTLLVLSQLMPLAASPASLPLQPHFPCTPQSELHLVVNGFTTSTTLKTLVERRLYHRILPVMILELQEAHNNMQRPETMMAPSTRQHTTLPLRPPSTLVNRRTMTICHTHLNTGPTTMWTSSSQNFA